MTIDRFILERTAAVVVFAFKKGASAVAAPQAGQHYVNSFSAVLLALPLLLREDTFAGQHPGFHDSSGGTRFAPSKIRSSADQSASAKQSPAMSGWPARIS